MMKVGIYTPYLDSYGGGERYILTIAEILSKDHQVEIFLDQKLINLSERIVEVSKTRFGLNLEKVKFTKSPFDQGFIFRSLSLRSFDLLFYLTDGSFFYSTAKKSYLHFQVPFTNLKSNFWQWIKLSSWKSIYNSKFTKEVIEKNLPIQGEVIYPPIDVLKIKPQKKEKIILNIGRFASFTKSKKHEVMIDCFKNLYPKLKDPWNLHLAGGVEGDQRFLESLRVRADGFPIVFHPDISFTDLIKLYGSSAIYWHAAGFGESEPEKMEHFGISTVEAMAGGSVPVVINKGGQVEIVQDNINGFLWDQLDELQSLTLKLIEDESLRQKISIQAVVRSQDFSKEKFAQNLYSLIK